MAGSGNEGRKKQPTGRNVERVYSEVKKMAINYEFRPGDRVNEVALASRLNTSRTPLREALNRLATEGFLTQADKPGFYCRPLTANDVCELYECRIAIETRAARLATERASIAGLKALQARLEEEDQNLETLGERELLQQDERFHQHIADLSENGELARLLSNINERIHFVRSIKRDERREEAQAEHEAIAAAMVARDARTAEELLERHIHRRREDIVEAIRIGVARIYMRE